MTMGEPARLAVRAADLGKQGRHGDAVAELERALAINPRNESVMYALAQQLALAGRPQEALVPLGNAVRRQPHIWKSQAAADPAFERLRDLPAFRAIVNP
jgi:thioredoxin-like negative regulator of GroEL